MAGTFFVYGKNQKTQEMVRWKIWQKTKVFPTFFVWLLEGVPFIVVFGFSEKVFKYLSSLFCWDLSGLPLSLCPTFMYLVPQKVLFWLSSVCWVRKLNTLKWDILATDVAVYFDSKLRKLKVPPYKKCGEIHEKFDFLENTRFKILEHLLKAFWKQPCRIYLTWP